MTEDIWETFVKNLGSINPSDKPHLPDFFIISPPRTGSTWLSVNLCCHPDIFIPEKKEIHYFNSYCRVADFQWYLNHFKNTGNPLKGEATPSYSILPLQMITLVKSIMPRLKLIFIMREPVERAWSEIKLNHSLGMGLFARNPNYMKEKLGGFSRQELVECLAFEWILAHSDYLGCLQRWLSVFPREQVYLGFYENLLKNPETILEELFVFLGVTKKVDWIGFRIQEQINQGAGDAIPPEFKLFARSVFHEKTHALARFLNDQFHMTAPCEWENNLKEAWESTIFKEIYKKRTDSLNAFQKGYTDDDLKKILNTNPAPVV